MKKILGLIFNAIVGLSFGFVGLAWAQSFNMPPPGGVAVIGCIYNSSPPTNTSGLPAFVQCDVNGQLKTTGGSGGGGAVTIANGANTVEGSTTDTAATTGTGTFTMKALLGGILNTLINNLYTTGTAGTPSTQVVTVQGIAGMTPLLVTPSAPADPCFASSKINVAISTASGTTALVTGVSAKKIYVCSMLVIAPSAVSVSLAEGSSNTCGTSNQAAVIGVATNGTAANGVPLAANGGWTLGSGNGTVAQTATAANYLCLFQSGTAQLAGNLTYVQQ